jgi:hypothetical protein
MLATIQIDAEILNNVINVNGLQFIVQNAPNPYINSQYLPYYSRPQRDDSVHALTQRYADCVYV